jgi:transposase, IS5 family
MTMQVEAEEECPCDPESDDSLGNIRDLLESVREKPKKSNAGRKPLDVILLFKLMILQQLYNISDEELEYQVNDRLSFMQFLGLSIEDSVPDATTL